MKKKLLTVGKGQGNSDSNNKKNSFNKNYIKKRKINN